MVRTTSLETSWVLLTIWPELQNISLYYVDVIALTVNIPFCTFLYFDANIPRCRRQQQHCRHHLLLYSVTAETMTTEKNSLKSNYKGKSFRRNLFSTSHTTTPTDALGSVHSAAVKLTTWNIQTFSFIESNIRQTQFHVSFVKELRSRIIVESIRTIYYGTSLQFTNISSVTISVRFRSQKAAGVPLFTTEN